MYKWTKGILVAAILTGGCTGTIDEGSTSGTGGSGGSKGSGTGGSSSPGSGGSKSGTGGSNGSGTGGTNGGSTGGTSGGSGGIGSGTVACSPGIAPTSQVRRLTNSQYEGAVANLLGVTTLKAQGNVAPSVILATDQDGSITDIGWSTYQSVADLIATQVIGDATLKKNFMACTPTGDGKTCFHDTIVKFGRKAFRRPLTTDEVAGFDALVTNGKTITATGSTDEIAQAVLYMFLISPSFLQRAEVGVTTADSSGNYPLTSYEVATRLSFMLWSTTPDDMLNTAADMDQLKTTDQILTQAKRMLKDDRARTAVAAFHRSYMLMATNSRWDNANHDTKAFPNFNKDLVPTLEGEMEKFFDSITFAKSGTFQDLLTSNVGFVTAKSAPIYGLDGSKFGTDYKETTLDTNQRPGFLTRAGFLGAYSAYTRSSPILRGAFIMKQVLGVAIPAPPPGAEASALPDAKDLDTNRKQVDAQTSGADCMGCHHEYINPPGFVMDAYDSIGQWQTKEASTGVALDTTAEVMIDDKPVHMNNPSDLMKAIAASPAAQQRYAQKWVGYAFERDDNRDCGTVNDIGAKMSKGGYTITNLITDLTQAQQFRVRAVNQ